MTARADGFIDCRTVVAHPLSVRVYGKPRPSQELMESLEKVGMLQPLVVAEREGDGPYEVLAGNTRAAAWRGLWEQKRVESPQMPCRFVRLSSIEAEQLVIESNR